MAPTCRCNKRYITVTWAVLECLFFTGIVLGWPWLCVTLRRDRYFLDLCNVTIEERRIYPPVDFVNPDPLSESEIEKPYRPSPQSRNGKPRKKCRPRKRPRTTTTTTTMNPDSYDEIYEFPLNDTQYFCDAQEEKLEIMYSVVMVLRNALIFPLGIFLDFYGTTKTRLIAVLAFVMGTLVMTFSNLTIPWLVVPAFSLISLAGLVILLTNLQVSNLFGSKRYTIMASLIGAFHSSSVVLLSMKETHTNRMETQTSFMFLTIGVVPILVSTIAFLPKSKIPWPLPADYGKRNCKDSSSFRRQGQAESDGTQMQKFRILSCSSLYVWSVVWFSIYNLRSFTYDGNVRLMLTKYGTPKENVHTYSELYAMLQFVALLVAPLFGLLLDWRRKSTLSNEPCIQQMQNILLAIVVTFLCALTNNILPTVPSLDLQIAGFVLQAIERVAVLTCMCAFLSHVHFPIEQFGKLVGIHFMVASVTGLLKFPFQTFTDTTLQGDPFYINLFLLVLLLVSCGHPINVWYHCRLGLISNPPTDNGVRNTANERLVEEAVIHAEDGQ